ncbi:hypothetical protein TcCL_Unassigned06817 [Trypanosoma cruzi]|nr:hypothetical protein TcCL_Unassigned06817 [Trypanosoma cruzi]
MVLVPSQLSCLEIEMTKMPALTLNAWVMMMMMKLMRMAFDVYFLFFAVAVAVAVMWWRSALHMPFLCPFFCVSVFASVPGGNPNERVFLLPLGYWSLPLFLSLFS